MRSFIGDSQREVAQLDGDQLRSYNFIAYATNDYFVVIKNIFSGRYGRHGRMSYDEMNQARLDQFIRD